MTDPAFNRICIIGIGLIGSSLAHVIRREKLAGHLAVCDMNPDHRQRALDLGIADSVYADAAEAVAGSDIVVVAAPIGAFARIGEAMKPALACVTRMPWAPAAATSLRPCGPRVAR